MNAQTRPHWLRNAIFGVRPVFRKKPPVPFAVLFKKFKSILERNNAILEIIGDMGDKLGGDYIFDRQYLRDSSERLGDQVFKLISDLSLLCQRKNVALFTAFERIQTQIREELAGRRSLTRADRITPLSKLTHELVDEGGAKMAHLGDIRNILGYATPDGFAITAGAYFEFMEQAGLRKLAQESVAAQCALDEQGNVQGATLEAIATRLQQAIMQAPFPKDLAKDIEKAARTLAGEHNVLLAVRSSAWGEDGESSYAGMYESVLGVPAKDILLAYRRVLASLFCEQALRYRQQHGQDCEEPAMAVGVLRMIDAAVSGGMYTYAPLHEHEQPMVVSAAWGLGKPIVEGTVETDSYILRRDSPHDALAVEIGCKATRLMLQAGGGLRQEDTPESLRNVPCLTQEQIAQLGEMGMQLERFFKRPLDVEWAIDQHGRLNALQARPLTIRPRTPGFRQDALDAAQLAAQDAKELIVGHGLAAMGGVASGPVHIVTQDDALEDFPYGAILVTHHSSPRFAKIMPKCHGIIAELGSATGHMATIARELRIPTLVGADDALRVLRQGQVITLDADSRTVYEGEVDALRRFELTREDIFEESREYRTLKRVLKRVSPLTLLDPEASTFRPEGCLTYHDIARYVHQRAVERLIELSATHQEITSGAPRKLITTLPLGLAIIDVEGGIAPDAGEEPHEKDLRCRPLRALLEGAVNADMWETRPVTVSLGSFMSSLTRTFAATHAHPSTLGRNLAVISEEYLNLHLQLGYHFTVIDAFLGDSINDNYIFLRFMGGVTDFSRRSRRVELVGAILERFDFVVKIKGDMVTGRVKKHPIPAMLEKMRMLGGLIGYTRQLDAILHSQEEAQRHLEQFLQRIANIREAKK